MRDDATGLLVEARPVALGPLPGMIGFLLRLAQVQVYEHFFDRLGQHGVRPGEFSVLLVVGLNPGIRQGVVAQRLCIKRAMMTKLVRQLEDRGLVARRVPEADRRALELTLTPAGRAYLDAHLDAFCTHEDDLPSPLTPAEEAQLIALLQKFTGLEARP